MDEKVLKLAKNTYATLCAALDEVDLRYAKDADNLAVEFIMHGDDLPINIMAKVDAQRQIVSVLSKIDLNIPEDKMVDVGIVVSLINYCLADGSFDYNFINGRLLFRATTSFRDSMLGKDTFLYLLRLTVDVVEKYNDKFLMLVKGKLTWQQFVDEIQD